MNFLKYSSSSTHYQLRKAPMIKYAISEPGAVYCKEAPSGDCRCPECMDMNTDNIISAQEAEVELYRVRKTWSDAKSQLGAYYVKQNAINACPYGYKVFNLEGKAIYTAPAATGLQGSEFNGLSEPDAIKKVASLYTKNNKTTGMLASVGIAQFCLESGYGSTSLALEANNVHGMKAMLSQNTWEGSVWDGKSVYTKQTLEQDKNGNVYYITAEFRKYPNVEESIADRAAYFKNAMNGSDYRYPGLAEETSYKKAIQIIKDGGYATDVDYVSKLCNLVERWELTQYDTVGPEKDSDSKESNVTDNKNGSGTGNGSTFQSYQVKVSITDLHIRTGAGTGYQSAGFCPVGVYTIVEEKKAGNYTWGRLKSGAGWIALEYTRKV